MGMIAAIVVAVALVLVLAWALRREDARLRRRVRRYRELRLEGIEELRPRDPYPEDAVALGGYLREPDGRAADAERVLREELEAAREHTRRRTRQTRIRWLRRRRGAECLV